MPKNLLVTLLHPDAKIPRYMTSGAAGMDLCAALDESVTLAPGSHALIGTGLAMAIPEGYEGQVRPRSGLAARNGVTVLNSPGTIDCDYRGEVKVILVNHGTAPFAIGTGDRIAQLVIAPVCQVEINKVNSLKETTRGKGGFGSTGVTSE